MNAKSPAGFFVRFVLGSLLIGCLWLTTGCNSSGEFGQVEGTVSLDGKSLSSGRVLAVNESGQSANGTIAADGSYKLLRKGETTLPPGKYQLAVIAYDTADAASPEAAGKLSIPANYTEPIKSGLTVEVVAGKTVTKDLELKGSGPAE